MIDFDLLQKRILEMALTELRNEDETYIKGWVDGVHFTCAVISEIVDHKNNVQSFNSLPYGNDEIN